MNYLPLAIISALLALSLIANIALVLLARQKRAVPKEVKTIEAQQILHDLTRHGQSVIRITAISPEDVFWRSPK